MIYVQKKQEIETTQQTFANQLEALNEAIAALDTLKKTPVGHHIQNQQTTVHTLFRITGKCQNETKCFDLSRICWRLGKRFG